MTNFSYKSGGRVSRYLSDYRDQTVGSLNVSYTLEDWWEDTKQTQRIEEVTYGTVGQYGSYGIGSQVKGSGASNDNQVATGGIFVVGDRGKFYFGGAATCFAKFQPITNISCFGSGANRYCVYSYEAGNRSETVGQHGSSVINAGIGARRINSFQFVFDTWQSISRFTGAAECRSYIYKDVPEIVEEYNELDYGLITVNAGTTLNYGNISEVHGSGEVDNGYIRHTGERRRFGFKKVIGEAQAKATNAWVGYGRIRKFGSQVSPAIYGYIVDGKVRSFTVLGTADVDFSPAEYGRGVLPLRGTVTEEFCTGFIGSGSLKKFSGLAESVTWNPEEKQMLFSFIGTGTEKQTDSYLGKGLLHTFSGAAESVTANDEITAGLFRVGGSGHSSETDVYVGTGIFSTFSSLTESATWNPDEKQMLFSFTGGAINVQQTQSFNADGRLFAISGGQEQRSFSHVGSGSVLKLHPRKPSSYPLSLLANFTLEADEALSSSWGGLTDPNHSWHQTTKLGAVQLGELTEWSHEKHTEVYDQGAAVEFVRKDYGFLVQTNLINCVATSGTISTNTTATSGCIKVAPGTTLAIAPNNTYTIPNLLTTPSSTIDYGLVSDAYSPVYDYGWILDTSDLRSPYGLFRITSHVDIITTATYDYTSTGEGYGGPVFRLSGITSLPIDVSEYGSGNLFSMGGAAEAVSNVKIGKGLWRFTGDSHDTRARDFVGSGRIPVFTGAAESLTFNPTERDMLFSFVGGISSEKHTESYVGSGNLFTLSGASESITNAYDSDGLWRFVGSGTEKHTENYIGSGSLKKFSGLAESITWNPLERQMLFSFTGVGTEKHTEAFVGSGNLFAFSGLSECVSITERAAGLFKIRSFTHASNTDNYIGSGSLKKFSGLAESITWNPLERQLLFSFTGACIVRNTYEYVGSGEIRKLSGSAESIRWAAQHTTGLYRISGNATESNTEFYVGSGSLKKFNGLSESLTFNPLERDMLFSFIGGVTSEKHTESYVGSGFLRNFATLDERQTFDWVGSGTINLIPRKPDCYELEELANFTLDTYVLRSEYINLGNIDFYDGYTNLGDTKLWYIECEEGHEKHTEAYNNSACEDGTTFDYGFLVNNNLTNCVANSGTISTNTTAANGCIKVAPSTTLAIAPGATYTIPNQLTTPTDFEDYGLVNNPNAPQWRDYGHILDTLSKKCPYGFSDITGTAKTHFVENIVSTGYSVSGKAGLSLFGAANTFWTPPYFGKGLGRITGTVGESFTPATEIGSGSIRKLSGAAECIANVEKADGLFRISGATYSLFSLLHPGSGTIRVIGTGGESITPATHIGSGSLKKFSGAAESATWNPLERQMLFSFTGTGSETFTANPPEEGTEIRLSGTTHPELLTFAEQPFGRIPISGEGATPRTRPFIGSGSFKKFSGAAESITFNPLEKQLLFSFIGSGTEAFVANPPEEGTNIRLRGEGVFKLDSSYFGSGRVVISGDAVSKTTKPFIGFGSLKKFSGAAESITFNPLERQLLFSFTGTGSERTFVVPPEGDGVLFTFGGSTATSAAAYESTGLFKVGGFTDFTRSRDFIGSGSLRKISGAAESITFNPDEKQMLFSFTGAGSERTFVVPPEGDGRISIYPEASDYRFLPNWNGSGTIRVEVQSTYRFAPVWIGSGSLKKFSGAAESITFNPEEKQMLFSFTGTGAESTTIKGIVKGGTIRLDGTPRVRWVPNNIGSGLIRVTGSAKTHYVPDIEGTGGLWTWNGAAESQAIAITSIPTLFRVYGNGDISRSRPYIGSGSLKKFQGAAESITINPDEKQMLFSFLGQGATTRTRSESGQGTVKTLGESTVRFSPVYFGSGTARVSGEATITRARDFVGFGSLRKLSGAAESLTFNPEEKQMLFSFLGVGAESRTSRELSQSGVLTVRGTSGDPLLTFAEQPRVEIDITGDSYDLRAHAYQGSGRISNVNNADDAYVRAPYKGSGRIALSGIALVQVQLFQPPHTQVWII